MSQQIIVNADDYGHTRGVSAGIRAAHLQGIVTSTSVMMNRPYAVEALRRAKEECPKLGVGLHLVLTAGKPVLLPERVASLITPQGNFFSLRELTTRLPSINLEEVFEEWQTQLARFILTTGRSPDHLDSHHQISYFTPGLYEIMLRLADRLQCPIRKPFDDSSSNIADYDERVWDAEAARSIHELDTRYSPRCPQKFIGHFYDEGISRAHLMDILRDVASSKTVRTFELMCHPAWVDDELRAISSYNEQRGREWEFLTDPEVVEFIRQNGIELIPFSKL